MKYAVAGDVCPCVIGSMSYVCRCVIRGIVFQLGDATLTTIAIQDDDGGLRAAISISKKWATGWNLNNILLYLLILINSTRKLDKKKYIRWNEGFVLLFYLRNNITTVPLFLSKNQNQNQNQNHSSSFYYYFLKTSLNFLENIDIQSFHYNFSLTGLFLLTLITELII